MLKMNYKKALLAATVLTAFCANAAFAGDAPDKPTMRERVNKILKCEDRVDCKEIRQHKAGKHSRPQLTEEQIKEREARREAWKKMTPEERKEAVQKWRAERKEKYNKRVEAKMNKLTPEQRKEVEDFIKKDRAFHKAQMERMKKHHEAQREEMRDMTKVQREAIRVQQPNKKFGKHHKGFHKKGFRNMPPMEKVDK